MHLHRVLTVARKNLQSLRHDRRTVAFLVLMPLLMITVFGYTFGGNPENLKVYVVNLDNAPTDNSLSLAIINDLSTRTTLKITKTLDATSSSDPIGVAEREVKDAKIKAVLIFDTNFTADAQRAALALRSSMPAPPSTLLVYMDGTNSNIVQTIMADIQISVQKVLASSLGVTPSIVLKSDLAYGQDARFIDFFAPGVMGLAAMMVTFMLSIISFVHERSAATLDRLLSTPVTEGEIVAGYALAFGFVGLIQSTVIIAAAVLLFQITIEGSVLLALGVVFVFGVGTQGLGFLLSSLAKNEFQAIQFFPIILFPSILLSGVFWPIEAVPELIRPISNFVPLTYAVDGLRSVMIRGWGPGQIWLDLVVLIGFAIAMLALSAYGLRKRG